MREDLEPEERFSKQVGKLRASRQAAMPSVPGEAFYEGKPREPEGLHQSLCHKTHTVIPTQNYGSVPVDLPVIARSRLATVRRKRVARQECECKMELIALFNPATSASKPAIRCWA